MRPLPWTWALFLSAVLTSCKNDLDRVAAIEVPANGPDRVSINAEYLYSDSGKIQNRLRAGKIAEYMNTNDPRRELSDGVELTFYGPTGQPGSSLTARRGRILPNAQRMEVEEQVVFINARGERLETEQLTWDQDSGRVHTDLPVKVTRTRDIIYGQGLDASQDFSRYTIRHITGSLFLGRKDTLVQ
jgi:LPS export ABC transporter protein LptC